MGKRMARVGTCVLLVGTALATGSAASAGADPSGRLLEGLESDVASDPTIPGEILAVRAPGLRETIAAGVADVQAGTPLEPDTPFRVASMTKTFVAAAVLRLVEERKIELDEPIAGLISPESRAVLDGDGYDTERITVRQLLQHTAGFYDYASDLDFEARAVSDPTHRWTRLEQLEFAASQGDPLSEPGDEFHYSDTGYILLGEILERVTGQTLPQAVRGLLRLDELSPRHPVRSLVRTSTRVTRSTTSASTRRPTSTAGAGSSPQSATSRASTARCSTTRSSTTRRRCGR
jgi:D-alanyl-D-alanine carboxypeptidase